MTNPLLAAEDLHFAYDSRPVLQGVTLSVAANEFLGVVGPNGSGKTTLLHTLLGLLRPQAGAVRLCGDAVGTLARREVAKRAALVPQDARLTAPFTVREVVAMGRNPYLGRFRPEGVHDIEAVQRALCETETESLAERFVDELSGGERQRVLVARAVAQETPVILLDEPTANLDVAHQLEVLELVRGIARQGRCAVAALHDLTLASRYCDRLLILHNGRIVADGPPEAVITEENLVRYFRVYASVARVAAGRGVSVLPLQPVVDDRDATGRLTPDS